MIVNTFIYLPGTLDYVCQATAVIVTYGDEVLHKPHTIESLKTTKEKLGVIYKYSERFYKFTTKIVLALKY